MTGSPVSRFHRRDAGQSLVELALAVPLLLATLLGMVDVSRAYVYQTAVTNAAREAGLWAAKHSDATLTDVRQRAWNETGLGSYGSTPAAAPTFDVACTGCGTAGADVTVSVTYQFELTSGYLFSSLLSTDHFVARATVTFRSLTQ